MADTKAWAFFEAWAMNRGVNYSTWLSWRMRGIPHKHRLDIMEAARARRIKLSPAAFDQQPAREGSGK